MTAATPLRLWVVRHAGDAVAIVAAPSRDIATRRALDLPRSDGLALGDLTAAHVGTALPGVRDGVVVDLRPTGEVNAAKEARAERHRNRDARRHAALPALRRAYVAGASAAGVIDEPEMWRQTRKTTAIRRTIWAAMRSQDLTYRQIGEASGHHLGTVAVGLGTYHRNPGDPVLDAVWDATIAALDGVADGVGMYVAAPKDDADMEHLTAAAQASC